MFDIYPEDSDLMNISEAILNCKPSTVCRLCREKAIVCYEME